MGALNNAIGNTQNNTNISVGERYKLCMEKYTEVMQMFVEYGNTLFSLPKSEKAVSTANMNLRPGTKELLTYINDNDDILNF